MIRCDKQMKEKKERTAKRNKSVYQWRCTGNCRRCICGMYQEYDGVWSHVHFNVRDDGGSYE